MENLVPRSFLLIIIHLISYSNSIDFDEGCFIDEPASLLQVAFVMDNTGTFVGGANSFFLQFAALAPKLMEEIDKDHPGVQFAHTIHADWPISARPSHATIGPQHNLHNISEACYNRTTKFTTDRDLFSRQMARVGALGSGEQENGLSALAFTAADTSLGWIRNSTFTDGRPVRRVLILVTDEDDLLKLGVPGDRGEFKGDGTDTCSTSKPPTHKVLKEVFEKYQMTVISLLAENSARPNLTLLYRKHFEKIGSSIKYCSRSFVVKSGRSLWTDSELKQKDSKGFWSGEKLIGEEEGVANFQPLKQKEVAKLSETLIKARKYEDLIRYVKECLKETGTSGCLFGDPEGYNTLGF